MPPPDGPLPPARDLGRRLALHCRGADGAPAAEDDRRSGAGPSGIGYRRLTPSPVDVRLFLPGRGLFEREAGRAILERLGADPLVESVRRKGTSVSLRLTDACIAELGRELVREAAEPGPRLDRLRGRTFVVNFLNPNATKPLHVGHLRNASIGQALASGLEAAGATVVRQCYVCDSGRNVGEAMAGYPAFHAGEDPAAAGEPTDRFVGRCYSEYVTELAAHAPPGSAAEGAPDAGEHDPVARETALGGDRADELVAAWMRGEPEARELWSRVRGWALDGQAATLARIGARLDRSHHESESLELVRRFVERGLASGVFRREPDGSVVYPTAREEYARMSLVRADGFPTEHARVIALFLAEQEGADAIDRWMVVCGDEWDTAGDVELEVVRRLGPAPLVPKVEVLSHGMVTVAGSKMKSRDGRALLIDDFIDRLEASAEARRLAGESGGAVAPETVVEIAVKGYFLCRKITRAIEYREEDFTRDDHNPAWLLARAWCRACAASGDDGEAAADPAVDDDYRAAVMQRFQLRQLLHDRAGAFVGTELAKLSIGVAKWYLERERAAPALHAVVRALLAQAFGALGIRTRAGTLVPRRPPAPGEPQGSSTTSKKPPARAG